jgi:hypothetical protein
LRKVVCLRTEDDQQLRIIVNKGVIDRTGTRPFLRTLTGPDPEPAISGHAPPQQR